MNQELSQRIVAALVITALAAIFIPMLFDDPIDDSGQNVSQFPIPDNQADAMVVDKELPEKPDDVITPYLAEQKQLSKIDDGLESSQLANEYEDARVPKEKKTTKAKLDTGYVDESDPFDAPDPLEQPMSEQKNPKKNSSDHRFNNSRDEGGIKKRSDQPIAKLKALPVEQQSATKETVVVEKTIPKIKTATGIQRWYIQAGSFSKKENALAMFEILKKQNLPVLLESKDSLYRLKVGANLDKKHALTIKEKLDQLNIQNLLLLE